MTLARIPPGLSRPRSGPAHLVAQPTPELVGDGDAYALVAGGLSIMLGLPRLTRTVPAPIVAVVVLTAVVFFTGVSVPDVQSKGTLPTSLPSIALPDIPLNWQTLAIIAPFSVTIALVGLMESLMTAQLIDTITDTRSDKNTEARGQGIANIVTGALFFASVTELAHEFDFADTTPQVVTDLTDSHIWDTSAIAALDTIVAKYADRGVTAELVGLNAHSQALHGRLSGRLAPSH